MTCFSFWGAQRRKGSQNEVNERARAKNDEIMNFCTYKRVNVHNKVTSTYQHSKGKINQHENTPEQIVRSL
jgi:hypothetical protein